MVAFFRRWQGQGRGSSEELPEGLLTRERFEEQLLIERARADRAGASFSLLTFRVASATDPEARETAGRVLAHVLLKRTRTIDTKGIYGEGLGLIMPYTPSSKVDKVWENVSDSYKRRVVAELGGRLPVPELACEVYAYPSNERTRAFGQVGESS
jgi:hypothetical protein